MSAFDSASVSPDSVQLELSLAPTKVPAYEPHMEIEERFELFHAANPDVAADLEIMAASWFGAGNQKIGVKALYERLRWEAGIRTVGDAYKLNNDFTRSYADLLIERHPDWADRIDRRESPRMRRAA